MSTISLEGALANTVIGDVIVIAGTVARFWLLGGQKRTPARLWTDAFFLNFSVLVMGNSVGMYMIYTKELRIQNNDGYDAVATEVVDTQYLKIVYSVGLIYIVQMWSLKAAFLCLFYDLSRYLSRKLKSLLYFAMAFTAATFVANILFQFLKCRPLNTVWSLDPALSCSTLFSVPGVITSSWSNILSDLTILAIGVAIIHSLKLRGKEQNALFFVAFVGSVSIIATTVRFVFCYKVAVENAAEFVVVHNIFTWSSIEIVLAFVAFCLPALKAVFNRRADAKTKASASFMNTWRSRSKSKQTGGDISILKSFDVASEAAGSQVELNAYSRSKTMGVEQVEPVHYTEAKSNV